MTTEIPQPRGLPFVGNLFDITGQETPIHALEHLADIYGPIFKITVAGNNRIICSNVALLEELCDSKRFCKAVAGGLSSLRGAAAGLFTAENEDSDWGQAHRILMPAFGPLAVSNMFDEMNDIASQLVLKWARRGPNYSINVTDDFTRLTLDTISLCALDHRLNSFYTDDMHPFVAAMTENLGEAGNRTRRPQIVNTLMVGTKNKYIANQKFQESMALDLIKERRQNPTEKKDLMNSLLYGKDPETGQCMRDDLIIANMITFLVAGHETTSGLLSFAFLSLLLNPRTYIAAQKEVDEVVGKKPITVDHLKDLKYINAVLRETLRLYPTAPAFSKKVNPQRVGQNTTIGGGKWAIPDDMPVLCMLGKAQKDPTVYGEDANEFKPERMLDEEFQKYPKAAWKPFGDGMRACIGRAFAWQEALLVTALLLQRFNFVLENPEAKRRVKMNLTIKPDELYMKASLRDNASATTLEYDLFSESRRNKQVGKASANADAPTGDGSTISILYGSNTGTCESLAQTLASESAQRNLKATVSSLDSVVNKISASPEPVVVITASYEGLPPDNAVAFIAWLESLSNTAMEGVKFAVFACGHSDWSSTFHKIPKLVERLMLEKGGEKICEMGAADAAQGDIMGDFETWKDEKLWPVLSTNSSSRTIAQPRLDIEIFDDKRETTLREDVKEATVVSSTLLTAANEPEKRELGIKLPDDMFYQCGDYLAILPTNPDASVRRVLKHFKLNKNSTLVVGSKGTTTLPSNVPVSLQALLSGYVELGQPASKKSIAACIGATEDAEAKTSLEQLVTDYISEVQAKRLTLLDILEANTTIPLSFSDFLSHLPPMKIRYYSISSSPLQNPNICTVTYGVVEEPSKSGQGTFVGVASNHLRHLEVGDTVQVSVRPSRKGFQLPLDIQNVPLMMFCAGSGLAPFRGFLQERAAQVKAGQKLAPALLFVGCRNAEGDRLYAQEMDGYGEDVVQIKYAFSKEEGKSEGCKYVQDRLLFDKALVLKMWDADAKIYVCGSRPFAESVGKAARKLAIETAATRGKEVDETNVEKWMEKMRNERFVADIFS